MSLARLAAAAALLPVAVLGSGLSIPDDNRMVQQDGLIRFPVVPKEGSSPFGRNSNATKRQVGTDSFYKRSGTMYIIELTLGTPGQTVPVQFDTGSSELWVNPVCSKSTTPAFCDAQPRFTFSTSLSDVGAQGKVTYGTGYAEFEYVADYVAIGSARITQQFFGVAYDSAHAVVGIMGAGPSLDGWDNSYPLPIDSLADQGYINSRAFSMDLRGLDSDRGSVIFGGLDVKKYSGNLIKRPIIPADESPDGLTRYWVYLNGITVNQPDGKVVEVYTTPAGSEGMGVLLDSGYTLSALPTPVFQKLVAAFPSAQYESGLYFVDCLDPGLGGSLDFTFGDKVINVRYYDFVWHLPDSGGYCVIGAFADDEFNVLGDTFLRSAYVVYDQDNREIWLGQSADCGSELVPIGSGPKAVPIIEGKCGQSQQTSTTSTVSSTSTTSSTSTSTTETSTTSTTVSSTSTTSSEEVSSTTVSETSTTSSDDVSSTTVSETSTTSSEDVSSTTVSETSTTSAEDVSSTTVSETSTTSSEEVSSTTVSETATSTAESTTTTAVATTNSATRTKTTITQTSTRTYTITSCPPTVTHCPANKVTTEVVTITTAVCPETTGTFTIRKTLSCSASEAGCPSGGTKTEAVTVTLTPLPPTERTTHVVPGCTSGAPGPSVCVQCSHSDTPTTLAVALPTATPKCTAPGCPGSNNATITTGGAPKPTKIATAGAARAGWASAVFAVVGGAVAVAML